MSGRGVVSLALFLSFEVDGVPHAIIESPSLDGNLPVEDALAIFKVISRVTGQDFTSLLQDESGEED